MSIKQQVLDVVSAMPNNAGIDDIRYRLMVIESVNKGRREIKAGKGIPHKKACEILEKKWNIK
jgi:hypothetical protein